MSQSGIRRLTAQDAEAVNALTLRANAGETTWTLASFEAELVNEYNLYLGYEWNQQVVGFIGGMFIFDEVSINNFAVDPSFMRKGIGTALLQALVAYCHQKGATNFLLEVRVSNQSAIALYKKNDFKKIDLRKDYYNQPVEDAYILQLIK